MITVESLEDIKETCYALAALHEYAETCIFDKPEEDCFTPMMNLIGEGWDECEKKYPNPPKFKNGVYINDDSMYLGEGIVYAANKIDVSKLLSELSKECLKNEQIVAEFRYDLADNAMRYLRFYDKSPKTFMWNEHTMDWDKVWDIVEVGEKYGCTLSL